MMKVVMAKRFELLDKIGVGGFGEVYRVKDKKRKEIVALKMESRVASIPMLVYEHKILESLSGNRHLPEVYAVGTEGDFNYLAMEFIGNSLEHFHKYCKKKFDLQVILSTFYPIT